MKLSAARAALSGFFLLAALILLGWGLWPPTRLTRQLKLDSAQVWETAQSGLPDPDNGYTLTIESPTRLRSGDSALAWLTFSSAESAASSAIFFETYHLLAEARLELPGADLRPSATVKQPFRPGQSASFFWNVTAPNSGRLNGAVWFYVTIVRRSNGKATRLALATLPLEVESSQLAGLSGEGARRLGWLALLFSAALGLPLALKRLIQRT